jgi:hypothetical protein
MGYFIRGLVLIAAFSARAFGADAPSPLFDIRAYGAKPDGATLDSAAINRAIDAAHAAGGGTAYVPGGNWLLFAISEMDTDLPSPFTMIRWPCSRNSRSASGIRIDRVCC